MKNGGLTLVDMVKREPLYVAPGRGKRGHRHREGKGKEVSSYLNWNL